jgi:hypothetical protein
MSSAFQSTLARRGFPVLLVNFLPFITFLHFNQLTDSARPVPDRFIETFQRGQIRVGRHRSPTNAWDRVSERGHAR